MVDSLHGIGGNFVPPNLPGTSPAGAREVAGGRINDDLDRVEISDLARMMAKIGQLPAIRHEMVAQVKAQIDAGTYDSPQKLDIAVDRLIDDLA